MTIKYKLVQKFQYIQPNQYKIKLLDDRKQLEMSTKGTNFQNRKLHSQPTTTTDRHHRHCEQP